jgi:hypothetical protein
MTKLKLTPEDTRGLQTEERFFALANSLKRELPWILSVSQSGPTDDSRGIDFTLHISSLDGTRVLKVPFQVKSSFSGARSFLGKDRLANTLGVPVLVYGQQISDERARDCLQKMLKRLRREEKDFSTLYAKKPERKCTLYPFAKSQIGRVDKKRLLQLYRDREHREEMAALRSTVCL